MVLLRGKPCPKFDRVEVKNINLIAALLFFYLKVESKGLLSMGL